MADANRDQNHVPVALGQSNADATVTLPFLIDSVTGRVLVDAESSLSILTVTGTINDSNVTFTVATQPSVLVINGGMYRSTGGAITWTYLAGTLTLSSPVGTGGSIFGLE